jgi:hypothetical protein
VVAKNGRYSRICGALQLYLGNLSKPFTREVRDKKRQRKVLLVGKQPISYTHLHSFVSGWKFQVHHVGDNSIGPPQQNGGLGWG